MAMATSFHAALRLPAFADAVLHVAVAPYELELRSAFGTSHSSTTTRCNALIQLSLSSAPPTAIGYGEVGLPPKKAGCYLADYADIRAYVEAFADELQRVPLEAGNVHADDPFAAADAGSSAARPWANCAEYASV